MTVLETNVIDKMGVKEEGDCLALLISDHLEWNNEYEHLKILQDKINAYIAFLEDKQFEETYPDNHFKYASIEIHFMYDITENCEKFLQVVQDQVGELGIKIVAEITNSSDADSLK
ncbi:MAG: DUF6572 domain-containing protein [Anaerofustis sp.]